MRSGVYPVLDHFGHYFLDDWPDHWKITCDHTGRLLDVELMSAFCTAPNFPWQSCQYIKQAGTAKLGSQTEMLFILFILAFAFMSIDTLLLLLFFIVVITIIAITVSVNDFTSMFIPVCILHINQQHTNSIKR